MGHIYKRACLLRAHSITNPEEVADGTAAPQFEEVWDHSSTDPQRCTGGTRIMEQ